MGRERQRTSKKYWTPCCSEQGARCIAAIYIDNGSEKEEVTRVAALPAFQSLGASSSGRQRREG